MCFQPFKDKRKLGGKKEKRKVGKEIFIQLIVKETQFNLESAKLPNEVPCKSQIPCHRITSYILQIKTPNLLSLHSNKREL
jgi:hypothetical protein